MGELAQTGVDRRAGLPHTGGTKAGSWMVRAFIAAGLVLVFGWLVACAGGPAGSQAGLPDYNLAPVAADEAGMEASATEMAAKIRLGWNLGNALEASGGETGWGNPAVTREFLHLVKESGFDAVRLPVAWDQYADPRTGEIDAAWLARVRGVVQDCVDEGLYVLVNVHWDGGWLENHVDRASADAVDARQRAYWQQIAMALRDFDGHVMFASANEPAVETAEQMQVLARYHQTFVDAVRATGGHNAYRVLVVQGPSTDIEKTDKLWPGLPVDSASGRLMVEVHYYTPWNFAGMTRDEDWGKQFYYWGDGFHSHTDHERNATWGEEEEAVALFGRMKRKFVDAGIPVIIGEYAATRRSGLTGEALFQHLASRAYYHAFVTRLALTEGMVPFYWDNGGTGEHGSGIFDRPGNRVADRQTLDALLLGAEPVAAP